MRAISASDTQSPATAECLETFLPTNPTITMPAIGNANGSQGERLSAWRLIVGPGPEFGPVLVMVKVTV